MKINEITKTWAGKQEPGELHGHTVCTATNPNNPNYSGHSRGRKLHLLNTLDRTFCNMQVDEIAPFNYRLYSVSQNGTCQNCLNKIK